MLPLDHLRLDLGVDRFTIASSRPVIHSASRADGAAALFHLVPSFLPSVFMPTTPPSACTAQRPTPRASTGRPRERIFHTVEAMAGGRSSWWLERSCWRRDCFGQSVTESIKPLDKPIYTMSLDHVIGQVRHAQYALAAFLLFPLVVSLLLSHHSLTRFPPHHALSPTGARS